ncbi:Hypothetical protein Tcol_1609 [Trichococcus collinsii]|uniref:Uncharacterized protein n=1 Tax=Trichococcus collinsii TaxID=157076 RepID=A0AB38A2P3_9LACT|nr:Hypothetical protein Tcol_1609 [Trichococcus collinsii]SEA81061.1 hypothetical protein SAMN04488525_10686 [Trichococcus collinsii]
MILVYLLKIYETLMRKVVKKESTASLRMVKADVSELAKMVFELSHVRET